ncbi:dihydrodipicolinate synthase family protein [Microbacterium marinilacus]|nr:dihydrodipicolinate synthase family protein [Microbacterium marinilacus]
MAGVSAFPLTPLADDRLDEDALGRRIARIAQSGVDSITVLGSTGSGPYLSEAERRAAVQIAVEHSGEVPVYVGIGALRTRDAIRHGETAQDAGAEAVLLPPLAYQPLTDEEVVGLYADVANAVELPLIVYDNPRTTGVTFTDEMYRSVAALPRVASVKTPGSAATATQGRIDALRSLLPQTVTVGFSGDAFAASALLAGADAWYSVIAGAFPETALRLARAARAGDARTAVDETARLQPLWDAFAAYGSVRVVATIAEALGQTGAGSLPRPLRALGGEARVSVLGLVTRLGLDGDG